MAARRAVRNAKAGADDAALKTARAGVNKAKVALGERGEVWWTGRCRGFQPAQVKNTPYAQWYERLEAQ
nr:hypothetical protein [Pseudomonas syringae]